MSVQESSDDSAAVTTEITAEEQEAVSSETENTDVPADHEETPVFNVVVVAAPEAEPVDTAVATSQATEGTSTDEENDSDLSDDSEQMHEDDPAAVNTEDGDDAGTTVDDNLTEGEVPVGENDGLLLDRPEQSKEVSVEMGDPDQKPNLDSKGDLPEGYEVFLDDDGSFKVTYTISKDCDSENITIDLNKVMEFAKSFCTETDSTWLQPGDTRVVHIYIQSESGHVYKYVDESFVLTTSDLKTNQDEVDENGNTIVEDPEDDDVVGFDQQVLPDKYIGTDSFKLAITSPSVEELFVKLGFFTQSDADYNLQRSTLSYSQYLELKKYLHETYGTDDVLEGMKAYLLEYYGIKDGTKYAEFETMMQDSSAANDDLYSGTQANKPITIDTSINITNQTVANKLIGSSSTSISTRFPALQKLLNEKLGTSYAYTSSSQSWAKLKNSLTADGYTNIADLIPTSNSNASFVMNYLKIYNLLNEGDSAAYRDYLEAVGYDPDDFSVQSNATSYSSYVLTIDRDKVADNVICPLDPAARYNNFYKNLLSVLVAGSKEEVDAVTGGQSGKFQTVEKKTYRVVDADDGQVYEDCVPANEVSPSCVQLMKSRGLPDNTLVKVTSTGYIYGFGTKDGQIATADHYDGEEIKTYTSTLPEYNNDDWSTSDRAPQLADYMSKDDPAWQSANALFNKLLGQGISAESAIVSVFMAYNLDGPLTGNDYQDTEWSWASSIKLNRVDGEAKIKKTDEKGNVIDQSETKFALWQYKDEKAADGTSSTKKYYLQQETNDGNVVYSWVEATNDDMVITITTKDGLMDINYKLLEDMVYYLQEQVAPKGYELDTTIYIFCNEDEFEAAKQLVEGDKIENPGAINSEKPLEITIVNKKIVTPVPPTPKTPDPVPPTPRTPDVPPYTPETGEPYTPQTGRRRPYTPNTGDSGMFLFGGLMFMALIGCAYCGKELLENQ